MIDAMFQEGTDQALNDLVQRPKPVAPPPPPGVWAGFASSAPRGLAGGLLEMGAFGAEVLGAFGQVAGAYPEVLGVVPTAAQRQQAEAQRRKLLAQGVDYSSATGDAMRARAHEVMPDPNTTGVAAQLAAGLFNFGGKALGYGLTLGPLGPLALGGDLALTESDRLKQQGVDFGTRTKAGLVQGVVGAASMVAPVAGPTALVRFAKGAGVGVGANVGQSLAERAILRAGGYDKLADQFDPFDPVALGVGLVPGVFGAALGRPARAPAAAVAKPLADMGLGERQALRYDDVRLDAYAVQAAKRTGIPPEVLLAVKNAGEKSGLVATSPKGAQGVMQFMPATWKEIGRGDPLDPINSIDAGAAYLKKLHGAYGTWDAAVAHYNGGGAQAAIVRGGGVPSAPETAAYLQRYRAYVGKTVDDHAAAAVRAEPDLVPAARVLQAGAALEASHLGPDGHAGSLTTHVRAVETAMDQIARGERVDIAAAIEIDAPRFADVTAAMRSGIADHARGVSEPMVSAARELRDFVAGPAADRSNNTAKVNFGVVTEQARQRILDGAGVDVGAGSRQDIRADAVRHAQASHPNLTAMDWDVLPWLAENFQSAVRLKANATDKGPRLALAATDPASGYAYVVEHLMGKNKGERLSVVTFFKDHPNSVESYLKTNAEKPGTPDAPMLPKSPEARTSETISEGYPSVAGGAEPPQGKARDLQAETIALRKQHAVLNQLLECLSA